MRTITYSNFEEASLSVAQFRSEGYIANCCDESAPLLWGPATVGGVRVFVSEEPVDDELYAEEVKTGGISFLDRLVAGVFLALFFVGSLYCLFTLAFFAFSSPVSVLAFVVGAFCVSLTCVSVLAILVEPMKLAIQNGLIASLVVIGLIIARLFIG